ncbi:MAG: MFS transporter [Candidatus Izemoplasmatales bacterium]|nr:MFS transporter [Candidatus Izemoplasmatales bacterium]
MKIDKRFWATLILFGLFGQLAWVIENMYFNLFLYNTISGDPRAIAWMVAASAVTATLTTIFMGALSDRVSKRKRFMSIGYILWGLATFSFAFISVDNISKIFSTTGNVILATVIIVIIMDCIMTFFGSMANDGAFNAWITDSTNADNRGKIEGVLAVLPLMALLIIFGGFDIMVQQDNWPLFFMISGGLVMVGGVVGVFLIKESNVQRSESNYIQTLTYGFIPKNIKKNKKLYIYLIGMAIFGISTQIYMPYFIIYMQRYLGIDSYAILLGVVLLLASVVSVLVGRMIKPHNKNQFFIPAMSTMVVGLIMLFLTRNVILVGISGFIMMSGNLVLSAIFNVKVRDYTPLDKVGHFQGLRMIFYVMIPMIIGPFIGARVITDNNMFYDDLGVMKPVPTPEIFIASAITVLFILIPIFIAFKNEKKADELV